VVTRKPEPGWHATPTLAVGSFGLLNPSLTLGRGGERLSALAGYSYRRSLPYRDGDGRRFTELANYRPENREDEAFSIGTAWGRVVWAPVRPPGRPRLHPPGLGAVLYPYLLMDALWDDTDRVNIRYEATGSARARRACARRATSPRSTLDDRRAPHLLAREAEGVLDGHAGGDADRGGQGGGGPRRADLRHRGLRAALGRREPDGGVGLRAAGHDPRGVGARGRRLRRVRALARHGMGLSVGGRIDTARSEADPALANVVLYEAYQGTRSLSASDTLPAAKVRLAWRRGPGRSRVAWDTPPACPRPPSVTWP